MIKMWDKLIFYSFILVFFTGFCGARLITVDDDNPADFNNIQAAINSANDGDVIIVSPGIYRGAGNRDIDFLGKVITVRSIEPDIPAIVANTVIDCQGSEIEPHRGFYFHSGENANSILNGLTIKNGYVSDDDGGAILCINSSPWILNCIISSNYAVSGGGIYCHGSKAQISNSLFINNHAFGGGGIFVSGTMSCRGPIVLNDCMFINNNVTWGGGAGSASDGCIEAYNCDFISNSAGGGGGALGSLDWGSLRLTNCVVAGNRAMYEGAIASGGNNGPMINCTFVGNRTRYPSDSFPTIGGSPFMNCIIWNNSNPQLYETEDFASVVYSNIQSGRSGLGNINIDPCFVDPGHWDSNGTPDDANDDFWVNGDYHLKSQGWRWDETANQWTWDNVTSRCIDAGNPGGSLGDEPLTLDVDPLNRWGENLRIDMGAFGGTAEASMPPYDWALLADLDNNGTVDFSDFAELADYWQSAGENQPGDLNRDGIISFEDIVLLANDWLTETTWHE